MAMIRGLYDSSITGKSKEELVKFAKWFNKYHGSWPTVIGGWAVWAYYPNGFGSRDVDVVLPSDDWIENVMKKEYFAHNGFFAYREPSDFFGEKHYGKPIDPNDEKSDIIFFDLLSGSTPREDRAELGVFVDWNWANQYSTMVQMDDATIIVPEVELLLVLKVIGCLERMKFLLRAVDTTYWASKISKDYYDVANLATYCSCNKGKVQLHMTNSNLTKRLRREFLDGYVSKQDVLNETKTSLKSIESVLE